MIRTLALRAAMTLLATAFAFVLTTPATAFPPADPIRLPNVALEPGEENFDCMTIDLRRGYTYLFRDTSPIRIIKIRNATTTAPAARVAALDLNIGENNVFGQQAAIDEDAGILYVGTESLPAFLVKVAVGEGDAPMTRIGAAAGDLLDIEYECLVLDTVNQFAYLGVATAPARVAKFALGAPADPPTFIGSVLMNIGEDQFHGAVIDVPRQKAWFFTDTDPGICVQVALGAGPALPTRELAVTLPIDQAFVPVYDPLTQTAVFGSDPDNEIARIDLGADPPVVRSVLSVSPPLSDANALVVDPANGFGLVGYDVVPSRLDKFAFDRNRFSGMGHVSSVDALPADGTYERAVYDPQAGIAYVATDTGGLTELYLFQQPFDTSRADLSGQVVKTTAKTKGATTKLRASCLLRNDGPVDAPNVIVRAFLSDDATLSHDDVRIGTESFIKVVKTTKPRKLTVRATVPAPVTGRRILLQIDPAGIVEVQNRNRNIFASASLP